MQELAEIIKQIRSRLLEFYSTTPYEEQSIHLNAVNIAVSLVDFSIKTNPIRKISKEEEKWFEAGFLLDQVLLNSEWEDIVNLYYEIVTRVKRNNFFR